MEVRQQSFHSSKRMRDARGVWFGTRDASHENKKRYAMSMKSPQVVVPGHRLVARLLPIVWGVLAAAVAPAAQAGIDVRIASVTQTVPLPGPIVGEPVPVVVKLVNDGDVPAGPFTVSIWKNRTAEPTDPAMADDSKVVEGFSAGEDNSAEVPFEVTYNSSGTYTLWVWADAKQETGDVDPANNKYSILLTVTENWPDLLIEGIVPDTEKPRAGQPFNIVVTVRNQGRVDANGFHLALWKDRLAPPTDPADADAKMAVDGIAAGQTGTASFSVTYDSAGTYRVWLLADADHELTEINENNNAAYIEVPVGPRDAVADFIRGMCGRQGAEGLPIFGVLSMVGLVGMKRLGRGRRE